MPLPKEWISDSIIETAANARHAYAVYISKQLCDEFVKKTKKLDTSESFKLYLLNGRITFVYDDFNEGPDLEYDFEILVTNYIWYGYANEDIDMFIDNTIAYMNTLKKEELSEEVTAYFDGLKKHVNFYSIIEQYYKEFIEQKFTPKTNLEHMLMEIHATFPCTCILEPIFSGKIDNEEWIELLIKYMKLYYEGITGECDDREYRFSYIQGKALKYLQMKSNKCIKHLWFELYCKCGQMESVCEYERRRDHW